MRIVQKLLLSERARFDAAFVQRLRETPLPEGVTETCGAAYEGGAMNVYRPDAASGVLPAVLNFHGGGMAMGCKEFNRWFNAKMCLEGFVVLAADYRLIPEHSVFESFVDVFAAMDAAADVAARFGGDASRLLVSGDSAGAYLVAFAAAMQRSRAMAAAARLTPSRAKIAAMGLVSGMFCTTRLDRVGLTLPPYLYGKYWRRSAFARYVDPARWKMLDRMPPAFLVTSGSDMLRAHTLRFARALQKAGAPHEVLDFPKDKRLPHAFSVTATDEPETDEVIRRMAEWFRAALDGQEA